MIYNSVYDKRDVVMAVMAIQLLIMGVSLTHAYHVIGYLEGQLHTQQELDKAIADAVGP